MFFLACLGFGALLAAWLWPAAPDHVPDWMQAKEKVRVSGRVAQVKTNINQRLQIIIQDPVCETPGGEQTRLRGGIVWTWEYPAQWPVRGQEVEALLRIKPVRGFSNPGVWDTEQYWARQGVFYRAYARGDKAEAEFRDTRASAFWGLRRALEERVLKALAPENGNATMSQGRAMVPALLFGDRYLVDQETMDLFTRASLSHSLALSGLHVGFVAGLGVFLAWLMGLIRPSIYLHLPRPKLAVLCAAPLVLAYLWLGMATPSLQRAVIMFAFWGALLLMNRDRVLLDGLFLALVVILVFDPLLAYDLRLQLSALAVASIGVFWGFWKRFWGILPKPKHNGRLRRFLWGFLTVGFISLSVQIVSLPLVVQTFGQLSPSFFINLLWLPFLGLLVLPLSFSGLLLTALPLCRGAGALLLAWAGDLLDAGVQGLHGLDNLGLFPVLVPARPAWPFALGYWTLLACLAAYFNGGTTGARKPFPKFPAALGAVLLLVPLAMNLVRASSGELRLTVLDIGQGQSLVLEFPGGGRALIDGGGFHTKTFDPGQAVISPYLTANRAPRLDLVVLTHPDVDHIRGIYYPLEHFSVDRYVSTGDQPTNDWDRQRLAKALDRNGCATQVPEPGETIDLGGGVGLEVLHPPPDFAAGENNNRSLTFRLVWNGRPLALLPGDLESQGINALLANNQGPDALRAEVLVLPHHGAKSSFSEELYDAANPRLALASAGYMNYWDFPSPEVRRELERRSVPLYSTSERGAVTVRWESSDKPGLVETVR